MGPCNRFSSGSRNSTGPRSQRRVRSHATPPTIEQTATTTISQNKRFCQRSRHQVYWLDEGRGVSGGFQHIQNRCGAAKEVEPAVVGGDLLIGSGAGTEEATQLAIGVSEFASRSSAIEPAHRTVAAFDARRWHANRSAVVFPHSRFACQRIQGEDRHAETCHPIGHIASDFCLGPLIGQSPCVKSSADDGLVAKHRRLNQTPATMARVPLPAQASEQCDVHEIFVTLRGCRFACNVCYPRWNNDRCFWATLGNGVGDDPASYAPPAVIEATIASICSRKSGNSEMSPTSSSVNNYCDNLTRVGIDTQMQLAPVPAMPRSPPRSYTGHPHGQASTIDQRRIEFPPVHDRYLALGILWRRLSLNLYGTHLTRRGRPTTVPP
jgi:hypothetical protein